MALARRAASRAKARTRGQLRKRAAATALIIAKICCLDLLVQRSQISLGLLSTKNAVAPVAQPYHHIAPGARCLS